MEIKFKLNDSNTPGMRVIPNSDIQAREINTEMKRNSVGSFNLNDTAARNLAGRPSGKISYSDFANKSYPNTGKISEVSEYSNGGSSGGWSNWTRWCTTNNFGFIKKVFLDMYVQCTRGNYDQIGTLVEIVNTNDHSRSITREKHWGNGNNWTGSQSITWELGVNDLIRLGGEASRLSFRFKMYVNRGSNGATNKSTITLRTE